MRRKLKLSYLKLLRSKDGASKVSRGFAVGFGLEIIIPYTAYLGYALLIPLTRLFRTTFPSALVGNVICKVTFLPIILVPFGHHIGRILPISRPRLMPRLIFIYLKTLLGLSMLGIMLGVIGFFVCYVLYETNRKLRLRGRRRTGKDPKAAAPFAQNSITSMSETKARADK
ncbi:DUF2062 domain-containing protein [Paenibacillus lycopersici]|uniref:DUF2062 domain-containing protein n=1 Tax=Paenibacillus lycopersici TaxID=2704462 RepID=A0A6C0G6Z2_9BACL|nr:DUF2062 domain-containing protein [Paenibacillus lycopersici]QHT62325.1 DUF2062 domain-containing protein [Paenibacillus lycopersici]